MTDLLRDVRYSIRRLRQTSLTAGIVVASLAIGIAANTTVFRRCRWRRVRHVTIGDGGQHDTRTVG